MILQQKFRKDPSMDVKFAEDSIEAVLIGALHKLGRTDSYEAHLNYISSEWYTCASDLLLALEDGKAWTDLQLPGRLKIEMKSELLRLRALRQDIGGRSISIPTKIATSAPPTERWTKYFSSEHNTYFYYNNEKDLTQWDFPTGVNIEIISDISAQSTPVKAESSNIDEFDLNNLTQGSFSSNASPSTLGCVSAPSDDNLTRSPSYNVPSSATASTSTNPEIPAMAKQITDDRNHEGRDEFTDPDDTMKTIFVTDAYAADGYVSLGIPIISSSEYEHHPIVPSKINAPTHAGSLVTQDESEWNSSFLSHSSNEECSSDVRSLVSILVDMGFSADDSTAALKSSGYDLPAAASLLLLSPPSYEDIMADTNASKNVQSCAGKSTDTVIAPKVSSNNLFLSPSPSPSTISNKSQNVNNYSQKEVGKAPKSHLNQIDSPSLSVPKVETSLSLPLKSNPDSNITSVGDSTVCMEKVSLPTVEKKAMYAPRKKIVQQSTPRPSAPNLPLPPGY